MFAAKGLVTAKGGTEPAWTALERVRASALDKGIHLVKETSGEAWAKLLEEVSPSVVLGDAC